MWACSEKLPTRVLGIDHVYEERKGREETQEMGKLGIDAQK